MQTQYWTGWLGFESALVCSLGMNPEVLGKTTYNLSWDTSWYVMPLFRAIPNVDCQEFERKCVADEYKYKNYRPTDKHTLAQSVVRLEGITKW
jgi:hypothetical protein